MTQLSKDIYSVLDQALSAAEYSDEEQVTKIEGFETEVFNRVANSLIQKLPEHERAGAVSLFNEAESEEARGKLLTKLKEWLNEEEVTKLFQKTADSLFKEMLQNLYQDATAEQKRELEKLFTAEALGK